VIFALARQVGLDVVRLKEDMKAPDVLDLIARTNQRAQELGIKGTPAFIIGDQIIPGAVSADELKAKIAEARKTCSERKEAVC
jgi:protein-disulfide isomerase